MFDWLRLMLLRLPWCRDIREAQVAMAESARPWNIEPKLTREEILESDFALAAFSARWDGSSVHYKPIVDACEKKFASRAKVGFFDTDSETSFVQGLELKTIPTIGFFRHGQLISTHVGRHLDLSAMIEDLLAHKATIRPQWVRQQRRC